MPLEIENSLTRRKEPFVPLRKGHVGIYLCGPTVYGHSHIGHAKSYICFDVIVRYLRYLGYRVRYIQNITDVGHLTDDTVGMADQGEDKILKQAGLEQVEPMELVERYTRSYFEDMDRLNIIRPDISPRASGHIPEQIDLIEHLIDGGFAYVNDGYVYFSVRSFENYGSLSGRRHEDQETGTRVDADPRKKDAVDFTLWKKAGPEHILRWNSPWGSGYPGWHTECSAMSMRYLGETFDIHGGGIEHLFPHHECEIAQSEAVTGNPFVRFWVHNNMLTVNGTKMGKSLGNFTTIKDALRKVEPQTLRLFILNSHYRSVTDFSMEAIGAMARGMERLRRTVKTIEERSRTAPAKEPDKDLEERFEKTRRTFAASMDNDFNTGLALAELFELTRDMNATLDAGVTGGRDLKSARKIYADLAEGVLGLDFGNQERKTSSNEEALVDYILELRETSRVKKDWETADLLRCRMDELGYLIEDGQEGTKWRRK